MTKQIKIEDLIPLLNEGWVAMNKNGLWRWYLFKPKLNKRDGTWKKLTHLYIFMPLFGFNIAPVSDWEKSLIKIGGKNE